MNALPLLRTLLVALAIAFSATAAYAVLPDEVLDDPALEARARQLSAELRCLVCQNQSIDDSNAELARDLRILVRERLVAGDTDEEVMDFIVSRYGEFVLLKPRMSFQNLALWGTPLVVILAGGAFLLLRGRGARRQPGRLSAEEEARLGEILRERDRPN
ncbi:cytochrome c-type biogenesis protein CcmH [Aquibium oceanicum]|uniref:cytochrome c-type biogenesis protein n=1 Tax=Aquibium oceanicum TaxID=1670800 RepID=UPI000AD8ADA5